jgi:hypothetical protein
MLPRPTSFSVRSAFAARSKRKVIAEAIAVALSLWDWEIACTALRGSPRTPAAALDALRGKTRTPERLNPGSA